MFEMLFHYFPAFVAQVIDSSRVRLWLQHPKYDHINFDLDRTIVVDLDKTPSNEAIQWEDIEVDDYGNHPEPARRGFSTIGPLVPQTHTAGGVYLSSTYCNRHVEDLKKALWVPPDSSGLGGHQTTPPNPDGSPLSERDVQESALLYWSKDSATRYRVTRYHGFNQIRTLGPAGDKTVIQVAELCSSSAHVVPATLALNLDPDGGEVARPRWLAPQLDRRTAHTSEDPADVHGIPIFIRRDVAAGAGLDIPKRPSGCSTGVQENARVGFTSYWKLRSFYDLLRYRQVTENLAAKLQQNHGDMNHGIAALADPGDARDVLQVTNAETDDELVSGGPLNVLEPHPCDEVERIDVRLQRNCILVGKTELAVELQRLVKANADAAAASRPPKYVFTSLDLTAHSRGKDGVLKFDGLVLTKEAVEYLFNDEVVTQIQNLRIPAVRLLGCRTACYPAGRAALVRLHERLNPPDKGAQEIRVWGTRGDVFAVHYARGAGFTQERLLIEAGRTVGDAPPADDAMDVSAGDARVALAEGAQPVFRAEEAPTQLSDFPLSSDSSPDPEAASYLWNEPSFDALKGCVQFRAKLDALPTEVATARVYFVVDSKVHAFDLLLKADEKPFRIRLSYPARWESYEITDEKALYTLIGDRVDPNTLLLGAA